MKNLDLTVDQAVEAVFDRYPDQVRPKMRVLRKLIIETAKEIEEVTKLEESLKWGEPSYRTNIGSTIRMDWKPASPDQYAMYFQCTSRLVETFRQVFPNTFEFEGKRAILFQMEDEVPITELKYCVQAALTYHKVKHLPNLGI